jgi:hypothetical protein
MTADLPTATVLDINAAEMDRYFGTQMTIDVSNEAGTRWDQNITGFRAEEMFAFDAEPYVRAGRVCERRPSRPIPVTASALVRAKRANEYRSAASRHRG